MEDVRAWKHPEERNADGAHPAGVVDLDDDLIVRASGGGASTATLSPFCGTVTPLCAAASLNLVCV